MISKLTPRRGEIYDQIDKTADGVENGSNLRSLSYEEGVRAALLWVAGQTEDKPMDD
jgi:hypothetical protein